MSRTDRSRVAVLGLLATGEKTGYDLKREFEERLRPFWSESVGQIYPTLHKLRDEKLVTARDLSDGGRRRTAYRITARGRAVLRTWLKEPPAREQVRNEMALKTFLGPECGREVTLAHIDHFERMQRAAREQYRIYEDVIEQQDVDEETKLHWRLTLASGQLVVEARLKWCKLARRTLEEAPVGSRR